MENTTIYATVGGYIGGTPIEIILEWSASDPWAVNMVFGETTEWMVARDLLLDGMSIKGAGEGDMTISPQYLDGELLPLVLIYLSSPSGTAYVEVSRRGVVDFLDKTYEIVMAGKETIPDTEYEKLLDGAT